MMASLVDFHCHLDLYPDFESIIDECERKKIYTLTVTTTPRAWPRNYELTKNKKFVKAALGLHPQLMPQISNELPLWDKYFEQARFIGEIGLDANTSFYRSMPEQTKAFEHIIRKCSENGNKILTIHSVRAVSQILDIIDKYKAHENNIIVLHWFSGNIAQLRRAAEAGCYFSLNSQMFYNGKNRDLLKIIPTNRILTETDGPFTNTAQLPQRPENVVQCVELVSSILKRPFEEMSFIIENNLLSLNAY